MKALGAICPGGTATQDDQFEKNGEVVTLEAESDLFTSVLESLWQELMVVFENEAWGSQRGIKLEWKGPEEDIVLVNKKVV